MGPQVAPRSVQVLGVHVGAPQTPGFPPPPQVRPDEQSPHWRMPPQPSPIGPQSTPCFSQVVAPEQVAPPVPPPSSRVMPDELDPPCPPWLDVDPPIDEAPAPVRCVAPEDPQLAAAARTANVATRGIRKGRMRAPAKQFLDPG